jgi:hypothetical protein
VLKDRKEFSGRQERGFLFAHPDQYLPHGKARRATHVKDRLAIQNELVAAQRLAQSHDRVRPARELLVHLVEELALVERIRIRRYLLRHAASWSWLCPF